MRVDSTVMHPLYLVLTGFALMLFGGFFALDSAIRRLEPGVIELGTILVGLLGVVGGCLWGLSR